MEKGLYVYCLVGIGDARNFGPIGIGDQGDPVTTIAHRDMGAVVSSVPMTKYVVSKETMIAHEKVIEVVMKDHTVLPVRFHTVAPNAEEIRSLLKTRYQEFRKLLRELDNKVELGLKALWRDMNAILNEMVEDNEEIKAIRDKVMARSGEGAGRYRGIAGKIFNIALEEKKGREREALLWPLRQICSDFCLNRTYGDDMLMNAAFLVDRTREREFDSEVEKLALKCDGRIEFKYVGPVPPYSFVDIVVEQ